MLSCVAHSDFQLLQLLGKDGKYVPVEGTVERVQCSEVPATLTTMTLFNRLHQPDAGCGLVTRDDGSIVKCMEKFIDGYQARGGLIDVG